MTNYETEVPARPLVHFDDEKAGRDRSRARRAASDAISKVLKHASNEVFRAARAGESVDAYALNEAVLDAMRSATARREYATEFAHLGHIVQAVLENHADSLPAYAEGQRSRKIETLEGEVAALKAAGQSALEELEEANAQRERMAQEARDLRDEIEALQTRNARLQEARERALDLANDALAQAKALRKTVDYAKSMMSNAASAQVDGFVDGLKAGREEES